MKRLLIILSILSISVLSLSAQSNKTIDGFLNKETADAGTSLLLIAQAVGELPDSADADDAINWSSSRSWGGRFKNVDAEDSITSGQFHLALFQSFDVKGGFIYSLFKTPRSAAQEAGYQGFINGIPYVNHKMTPDEVLDSLSFALDMKETEG